MTVNPADLTAAQVDALLVLDDGQEHETWKRRSGPEHHRVNFLAAESLRKLGLVVFRFRYGSSYVRLTDAGREVLDHLRPEGER